MSTDLNLPICMCVLKIEKVLKNLFFFLLISQKIGHACRIQNDRVKTFL